LIWHQDDAIRKQCLESFENVFFTDGAAEDPKPQSPSAVVQELTALVKKCDASTLVSLEQMLHVLIAGQVLKREVVTDDILDHVWSSLEVRHTWT